LPNLLTACALPSLPGRAAASAWPEASAPAISPPSLAALLHIEAGGCEHREQLVGALEAHMQAAAAQPSLLVILLLVEERAHLLGSSPSSMMSYI